MLHMVVSAYCIGTIVLATGDIPLQETIGVASVLAIIVLAGGTGLLHILQLTVGPKGNRGMLFLIIGMDERVSTSKVQVALWTYAVAFALLALVFYAWVGGNELDETAFKLKEEYLILLGSPAAAALVAKASTASKVENGTIPKTARKKAPTKPLAALGKGLTDVVSGDDGDTDLFDFQYFLFTLVALVIFVFQFFAEPAKGLPNLPNTIVALTGITAAGYATKKVLQREVPVLTSIYPAATAPGDSVRVRGRNITCNSDVEGNGEPSGDLPPAEAANSVGQTRIMFGGRLGWNLKKISEEEFKVSVPLVLEVGKPANVTLIREDGVSTTELPFNVVADGGPRIITVDPDPLILNKDRILTVFGLGFGEEPGTVTLAGRVCELEGEWNWNKLRVKLPSLGEATRSQITVPSSVELVVRNKRGQESEPKPVQLLAQN